MITTSNYNKQHPLRVFEAFAGYGSQSLSFKYLKEKHPDFDFISWSSPCQDFSMAGLRKGAEEGSGTRSSLSPTLNSAMGHGGGCIPLFLIIKEI